MTDDQMTAYQFITEHPVQLGRLLGYDKLRDYPHGVWLRDMVMGHDDETIMGHRGSYKTTCLGQAMASLMILQGDKTMQFYRKTDTDVKEVIAQTKRILLHPVMQGLYYTLYGSPLKLPLQNATQITTSAYVAPRGAPQLTGLGIKGSITGKHADIIFTDDIVNIDDRRSPAEREATKSFYQELQNIRNPGGRVFNTGTPWHPEDAFALMPAAKKFDCYSTGLLSDSKMDELRASMAPSLFAANYELRHIAAEDALFKTAPRFADDADLLRDGICHIDASYGGGDFTAMTCARRDGDTIYMYGRIWHAHVDTLTNVIMAECERLMCGPIYMETNGDKGYLSRELRAMGAQTRPYHEPENKYLKIATYLVKWWPNIVFLRGTDADYLDQITGYNDAAEHDDAPDSAACVCRVLDRRRT